ncbi:YitT family protein [Peribacillus sp. SCS-155]|uniref:YitT family protein n=1 Tax=Peribacillus sedimenti TaxID=3115297 RepID=UPI003905848A
MITIIEKLVAIIVGSFLLAIGINGFLVPYHLIDGGIIGIALILHYFFDYQTGICMFILSVPLGIYAWLYERIYVYTSVPGLVCSSLMIDFLSPLQSTFDVPIYFSVLMGGTLIGIGIGLMLRNETSTGGTELLAKFISNATSINIAIVIFIIDGIIVGAGSFTLGAQSFLFSCFTILIVGIITSLMELPAEQPT